MQSVGDVNLTTYAPVHSHAYYGDVSISETGSVRPTEPVSDDIVKFLESLGINPSVWNGTEGVLGRSYVSTVSSSQEHELTLESINRLRSRYIDVKRSLYIDATRQQLGRERERLTKLQRQLEDSISEMEQKIERYRTKLYSHEVRKGDQGNLHDSLSQALQKLEGELPSSKRAEEAIRKKLLQTRVDIAENETGFLRRFAILRTIFSESSTWTFTEHCYKSSGDLVSAAKSIDKESKSAWTQVLHAKRFYVDAKIGLACLYNVENTLKSILENLEQAMRAQKGTVCELVSSLPSQVGVEYRLGYVRKLWGSVEPAFKAAMPYVTHTSLRDGVAFILAEKTSNDSESLFESNPNDYGTFMNSHALLPSLSKIELAHPINKTARIAALHKGACAAYKLMNRVYDSQEVWIQKAVTELKQREQEECVLNDRLIAIWERLLAIETENM